MVIPENDTASSRRRGGEAGGMSRWAEEIRRRTVAWEREDEQRQEEENRGEGTPRKGETARTRQGREGRAEGREGGGREGPKSGLTEESKQRSSVGRLSRSEWAKTNKVLHFQISTLKTWRSPDSLGRTSHGKINRPNKPLAASVFIDLITLVTATSSLKEKNMKL